MIYRVIALAATAALLVSGALFAPAISNSVDFGNAVGSFNVKPADQSIVCPGSLIRSGGSSGTALGDFSRTGSANLRATSNSVGELEITRLQDTQTEIFELSSERQFYSRTYSEATELRNTGANETNPQGSMVLSGSSYQLVATDSMRGLAAASCQQPQNDFWLVGGSTAAGRESLLILTNPTPIDAVADIRIFTDLGEQQVSGLSGISVIGRSTTILSLASFAPTVSTMVVQVQSQGAKLAGWIQQRAVRGTAAQGVDLISPIYQEATDLVIPGLAIRGSRAINQLAATEAGADAGHGLRVLAPNGANITVQIISSDPEIFGAVFTATLDAGMVEDFSISELGDGDYTVFISSDEPVYAALRVARGNPRNEPRVDFSWINPSAEIIEARAISPADTGISLLVLGNPSAGTRVARIENLVTGARSNVSVPAFGTASYELSDAVSISSDKGIFGTVVILIEGQIASLEITDPKNIGSKLSVRFR